MNGMVRPSSKSLFCAFIYSPPKTTSRSKGTVKQLHTHLKKVPAHLPARNFNRQSIYSFFLGSLHIYHHPCMKVAVMVLTTWVLYQRHRVATFGTAQPTGTRLQLFGLTAIQKGMEKGWRHVEAIRSGGISWI